MLDNFQLFIRFKNNYNGNFVYTNSCSDVKLNALVPKYEVGYHSVQTIQLFRQSYTICLHVAQNKFEFCNWEFNCELDLYFKRFNQCSILSFFA